MLPSAIVAMIAVIAKVRLRTLIVGNEEAHVETAAISAVKWDLKQSKFDNMADYQHFPSKKWAAFFFF